MSVAETQDAAPPDFAWKDVIAHALAEVKTIELPEDLQIPSLPSTLTEFLEAAVCEDYDIRQLGQIVERDAGMTVDLLKFVNTAANGAQRQVKSATEALIRLGVTRARNHLVAESLKSATLVYESRLMNHRNFWNESLRRALFAQQAAKDLKTDADLAFIGGLLQDFVLPLLTNEYDQQYISFLRDESPQGVSLADWERRTFGWDHGALGAHLAQKWYLPDDLLGAILLHHRMDIPLKAQNDRLFDLFPVTLAALLPDQLSQSPLGVRQLLSADARSAAFRLNALCEAVDDQLEEIVDSDDTPLYITPIVQRAREALNQEA